MLTTKVATHLPAYKLQSHRFLRIRRAQQDRAHILRANRRSELDVPASEALPRTDAEREAALALAVLDACAVLAEGVDEGP